MKRIIISLAILALLGGFATWWFSDTQVLKRRTQSLLTTLTLDSGTGKVGRQMGTYSLNALLAGEVVLDTPTIKEANGSFQRDELESIFSWLCTQAKETRFELLDLRSVTVNRDKAQVDLTLFGLVVLPNYRTADGKYAVTSDWQKEKDGWRLTRASWQQLP